MARHDFRPFDAADHVETAVDVVHLLEAAFEDGDPAVIADALGVVARSKGMAEVAARTGLSRESLYRALGPNGNPTLKTLLQVLSVLDLKLSVTKAA